MNKIQRVAFEKLTSSKGNADIVEMMEEIFTISEAEVQSFLSDEDISRMDCKEGCSTCCRINVSLLEPGAIIITDYLIKTLSPTELAKQKAKMSELVKHIRYLDDDERIFANKPCAFLNEHGGCSIYPVRPFLCRSVTSADKQLCKDAISMLALGESISIPMHTKQKQIMDAAFKAVAKGMDETGQSSKSMELTAGVLVHM